MSRYATTDPRTGEVVARYDAISDAEVDAAVGRADDAYRDWRRTDVSGRTAVLQRVADIYRERKQELAELMTLEMGKPVAQALGEVELAARIYEYYATTARDFLEEEVLDISGPGRAVVRTEAIGPLLGIMPWNFPYYQVARFVAPNLLLGNTILLKHARNCPQEALVMEEILLDAGAPEGVYQNLFATSEQLGRVIADPAIRGVSLTGSERAGEAVGRQAGEHLKKCVLELGGSDPLIVLGDADLAKTASAAATGRFANAGQACTSSKRILVEDPVWDEFLAAFLDKARQWTLGDPADPDTRMGPMSSADARSELADQVADAVSKGATVHLGGEVPEGEGAYYPATVLTDVTPDMRAYREELFGPVAVLHRVDSADEAVEIANDSPFGLGAAVFAGDPVRAQEVAERLETGMVGINTTIKSAPDMPFGGVKSSGVGRELGRFGLDEFSNKKLVHRV
ncbi:NAD-dependent succinate-semialdehyde dehydrogenase [Dietzia sp. CQ4]|uniref:aldehyde dehydrogenase family protein n=1 Tax=Dietzia sp. (strain CQ4) TaxID=370437 RepID=UPI0015FAD316|nr:NAD-dependent succinate-semialdehyde dehydrogenase [Dietzia sp. CQ4]